jgi:hypothetical protein
MHRFKAAVLCLLIVSCVWAKSGPPIPRPQVEVSQAVTLARDALLVGDGLKDVKFAAPRDYILVRVEYKESDAGAWMWEVEFVHPIYNDHMAQYAVNMDGRVVLKRATQ